MVCYFVSVQVIRNQGLVQRNFYRAENLTKYYELAVFLCHPKSIVTRQKLSYIECTLCRLLVLFVTEMMMALSFFRPVSGFFEQCSHPMMLNAFFDIEFVNFY